jgi:hypothetical protein
MTTEKYYRKVAGKQGMNTFITPKLDLVATLALVADVSKRFRFQQTFTDITSLTEPEFTCFTVSFFNGECEKHDFAFTDRKSRRHCQIVLSTVDGLDGISYEMYVYDGKKRDFCAWKIDYVAFLYIRALIKDVDANVHTMWIGR